jgi:hypothetical protein
MTMDCPMMRGDQAAQSGMMNCPMMPSQSQPGTPGMMRGQAQGMDPSMMHRQMEPRQMQPGQMSPRSAQPGAK